MLGELLHRGGRGRVALAEFAQRRAGLVGIAEGRVFADNACVYVAREMRVSLIASAT